MTWVYYLPAIFSSAFCQYFAAKFVDSYFKSPSVSELLQRFEENPYWIYGAMLVRRYGF